MLGANQTRSDSKVSSDVTESVDICIGVTVFVAMNVGLAALFGSSVGNGIDSGAGGDSLAGDCGDPGAVSVSKESWPGAQDERKSMEQTRMKIVVVRTMAGPFKDQFEELCDLFINFVKTIPPRNPLNIAIGKTSIPKETKISVR